MTREKTRKVTETLAHGYSSESTQWELSNEYQYYRVKTGFKDFRVCLVLWTKVSSVSEGSNGPSGHSCIIKHQFTKDLIVLVGWVGVWFWWIFLIQIKPTLSALSVSLVHGQLWWHYGAAINVLVRIFVCFLVCVFLQKLTLLQLLRYLFQNLLKSDIWWSCSLFPAKHTSFPRYYC